MLMAHRSHMRYSKQGRQFRRLLYVAVILFLVLGTVGLARRRNLLMDALPFFVLATVLLVIPLLVRRAVLKMYAQKPDRDMVVTYEITNGSLATRSEVASADMLWRTIIRAYRVPEGFLLYLTDRAFHWLPLDGFHDSADVERPTDIIKSKVSAYVHVT